MIGVVFEAVRKGENHGALGVCDYVKFSVIRLVQDVVDGCGNVVFAHLVEGEFPEVWLG